MSLNIHCIIQARMTSTRLPGKVMKILGDKSVLQHVIDRCSKSIYLSKIIIASPFGEESIPIRTFAEENNVQYFEGLENDVLNRYYCASQQFNSDIIVRITSDCPLIDPCIIDAMLSNFLCEYNTTQELHYYSNTIERTFPRGLDVEIFTKKTLEILNTEAFLAEDREHVTRYIYFNLDKFNVGNYKCLLNLSKYRLTLDTEEDFNMFKELHKFNNIERFYLPDIIKILEKAPFIQKINENVVQKSL
ncbi:cytidylyltransferase domain-containing protein [Fluviispira vulneris]|uniref:cytidylyltransferase domain-containing protein n=1 Tax=Fluviispira vulneris TaxID=2763012 RepID=UPI001646061C|nr:glycosyltransferase family protein [Fluviispira vulneris]